MPTTAKCAVIAALIAASGAAADGDEPVPDLEFLEYLGMWEETDEDWQLIAENETAGERPVDDDKRSDPALAGEESMENEDES